MESSEIFLAPGGFYFGGGPVRVRTVLGSCVAIVLWHSERRIGGMCHFMLPSRAAKEAAALDGRYADEAVALFVREIAQAGTRPRDYIGKLFGGGNMFSGYASAGGCRDVPCMNVEAARRLIRNLDVPLVAEHLGGSGHRNLTFELWSGDAYLRFWGRGATGSGAAVLARPA